MKPAHSAASRIVRGAMAAILIAAAWFSFAQLQAGQAAFESAQRELQQARSLASQIQILRQRPDRAISQSRSDQSLAESIENSAVSAGVTREQVARIEPQQPRRVGDSEYLEYATVVQLDGITLPQLATTLSTLRGAGSGLEQLRVSTLRIAAPYQKADTPGPEPWNAELTLTYLVYSPKTATPRKS